MKICQIVGYKNSGKTTVMKQIIRYYSNENIKVGSLKHHGHGGEPDLPKGTDSFQHFEAGSMISGIQGENITQFTLNQTSQLGLGELIKMYSFFPIDILLIEGYKQAEFPKIVLVKDKDDLSLLDELSNIIAVGSWDESLLDNVYYPTFSIKKMNIFLPQLIEHMTE